ncbi:hypothetical protein HanPI659440_Chr11g0418511 [Helianthus annuus]|uniref:Uncharacterized protein n=1 Tax=Helianthus annuus TaxID=4232 RepID=A0A251TAL7_HELAN|nr:hypothetical protein HanXRQr2_Chr11g0486941 [Helianthus annuus]KAJ0638611.1 hypothetical protein HanHA300_Chr00c0082g0706081 [Helianthus annuus]KAJ0734307.1 hypothetical protein HanPI659440_Chr11g0418511 [Helianthus annuus]KAJ0874843.1 hypothetical protein HanPSC8_Chr11g0469131 [Helianthus annuus]
MPSHSQKALNIVTRAPKRSVKGLNWKKHGSMCRLILQLMKTVHLEGHQTSTDGVIITDPTFLIFLFVSR